MIAGISEDELNSILKLRASLTSEGGNGGEILEPDDLVLLDNIMTKYILIAAASYFEYSILDDMKNFINDSLSQDSKHLVEFFNGAILDRGFTSLFDWGKKEKGEIKAFLVKFFGKNSSEVTEICKGIEDCKDLQDSILKFYKIILKRNDIIHKNMHKAEIGDDSLQDVIRNYLKSKIFVENFRHILSGDFGLIPVCENSSRLEGITLKPYKKNEQKNG